MPEMKKYRRREVAKARRLRDDERIVTTNGAVDAAEGDWLVTQEIDGNSYTYVLTDTDFQRDWVEWRIVNDDDDEEETQPEPVFQEVEITEDEREPAPVQSIETQLPKRKPENRIDEPEPKPAAVATEEVKPSPTHTVRAAADNVVVTHDAPTDTVETKSVQTTDERAATEVTPERESAPVKANEPAIKKRTVAKSNEPETAEQPTIPPVGDSLETRGPASHRDGA